MALLAWEKEKQIFLKVQAGTGDDLLHEDREQGYVDYVLWSIFEPDDLELDSELTMNCIGNGMVMTKSPTSELDALDACCRDAFNASPKNLVILMKNEE